MLGEFEFPTQVLRSVLGYKQTLAGLKTTSALHPEADLRAGVAEGPFVTQREHRNHDHRMQQHGRRCLVRVPIWDPNPTSSDVTHSLPAKPYPEREMADIRMNLMGPIAVVEVPLPRGGDQVERQYRFGSDVPATSV